MNWFEKKEISKAAIQRAEKTYTDKEIQKAFQDGVEWTLGKFYGMLSVHPMEYHGGVRSMCDKFRLEDFRKLVDQLCKEKENESL